MNDEADRWGTFGKNAIHFQEVEYVQTTSALDRSRYVIPVTDIGMVSKRLAVARGKSEFKSRTPGGEVTDENWWKKSGATERIVALLLASQSAVPLICSNRRLDRSNA